MSNNIRSGISYIVARLREASTWAGLGALLMAFGVHFTPEQGTAIVQVGIAVAGALAVFIPETSVTPPSHS